MLLADVIRYKYSNDTWCSCLKCSKRLEDARKVQKKRRNDGSELDLLECVQFCDKRDIVRKAYNLNGHFKKDLEDIEQLRHSLAHASPFAHSQETLSKFIRRLEKAKKWIRKLDKIIESITSGGSDACEASHPSVADK